MAARFRRPVYEGDLLAITASDTGEGLDLEATNEESVACAVGTASLPPAPATAPALDEFPLTPSPDPSLAATPEALAAVGLLGCLEATARGEEPGALVHPVWLLLQANALLATAVALGPWIHTASVLTNLAPLHHGEPVSVRARVAALSARRGHELVDLDILVVAEGGRPTTHIRHSAIYRLSPSEHEG